MKIDKALLSRANDVCELSGTNDHLTTYAVGPDADGSPATTIVVAQSLSDQLEGKQEVEPNDWRCLNDSMWSETAAVKVVAYRMLHQLRAEGWPQDLLDMIYLEEETLKWAKIGLPDENALVHKDSNGNVLEAGDTVVLIKDLKVKGANFTAKRGTAVRNIRLVHDNAGHIEGRVETQQIVILTEYVKKNK
ncbi:MAG: protein PhnA [Neolewinella sp.]|jgi:protein PhnA